jgi:hypothetical protein
MNAFTHTIAHEDNLALASEHEEQHETLVEARDHEYKQGRNLFWSGHHFNPFWTESTKLGFHHARMENDPEYAFDNTAE